MNKEKSVSTKAELQLTAREKYEVIHLKGVLAAELANEAEKHRKGNIAANVGLVAGLFAWPLLIAGVVGKVVTGDLKCYKYIDDENDYRLVLKQ